ncbi:DUF3293 domain-containing protein [Acetobacter fallax]|uniref:DUF3293 domain-containing protein n=1 Tax=Acetobacter fallax TaxID=1737473 RepID=UPI0030D2B2F1
MTPQVLRAYRLSVYRAGSLVVRVGERVSGVTGRGDIVLVSACNPGGRRYPDGWNARMMERLFGQLHGISFSAGEGRLGRWGEPLVAARMPLARGLRLARLYRQNAVVLVRRDQVARLVLVR